VSVLEKSLALWKKSRKKRGADPIGGVGEVE
jgi:hypothetical protein